ncbi:uncharacterized protein LOC133387866 isoform X3 [Rhineura floridana]|uniref:uncharacterized protein LOC133387866 isoform X3 n=1 Tax=Rhineura floridana TaxID=261503 RepID=UPI002AC894D1|nr:uncharacterized protein LOC133387866 isoform X3 [Rhineura floridana]
MPPLGLHPDALDYNFHHMKSVWPIVRDYRSFRLQHLEGTMLATPALCKLYAHTWTTESPEEDPESKECFICREGDEMGRDALLHFCDCKNLIAHQKCLLTWIQKLLQDEGAPRCKVCTAEYQLEKKSPWGVLLLRWHKWVVFCTILAAMISIPLLVYQMIIAFKDPPPSLVFHIASVCFGVLSEILLTKAVRSKYNLKTKNHFAHQGFASGQQNEGAHKSPRHSPPPCDA